MTGRWMSPYSWRSADFCLETLRALLTSSAIPTLIPTTCHTSRCPLETPPPPRGCARTRITRFNMHTCDGHARVRPAYAHRNLCIVQPRLHPRHQYPQLAQS